MAEPAEPPPPAPLPRPLPATFFGDVAPGNPVVDSLEAELRDVLGFLRQLRGTWEAEPQRHELHRRGANTLFNIWIKYKPQLPDWYYNDKLLKVGDSLAQIKVSHIKTEMVRSQFLFHYVSIVVEKFVLLESRTYLFLYFIFTGTIHIYTICRHLMMIGQSAKVLEYLLWASICMELSIPLLSVHYLTWRATLYAAVSQCYFDCQAGIHGEVFARRGLIQIDELKQLENISSSQKSSETGKIFREATIKMSVMIFKRAVYESRRKPKSHFRPKLRVSLKEAQNLPWPRTTTEQLLTEMFDGTAAQFLAILEALSDSSRRVLHPTPPVPDEPEIHDVISELFFAGLEILSGDDCTNKFEKRVSGEAAVKFVKLAFNYEEWDVFDSAIVFVTNFLQAQNDPRWKKAEMELKLLTLMQPLLFPRKFRRGFSVRGDHMPCVSDKKSTKCKTGLQFIQMNGSGYFKYNQKYKASKVLLYYKVFLLVQVSSVIVKPRKNTGLQSKCIFLW
uniref:Cilia and flagella associated protein 54 n=1 Tax=Pavo cristatus TaxID=9049 RepID=A0A8C9G169_PAVCR